MLRQVLDLLTFDSALAAALLGSLVVIILYRRGKRVVGAQDISTRGPHLKQNDASGSREETATDSTMIPGVWEPVKFDYPRFEACRVALKDRKPSPYRPFRWGKYNITMGIRNMTWDDWVEIDNQLSKYHAIRTDRVEKRKEKVVQTLPDRLGVSGGGPAAQELVYELSEYLSRRYPDTYRADRHPRRPCDYGWYGEGQIKAITIIPLNVTYDLDTEDPMKVASLLIEDDLALMIEGEDGRYYFQAGGILVPGFWRMEDKLGLPLEEIHLTGDVPQYREKLHLSLARFFTKLPVEKPVLRNNYFFQIVRPADDPARISSIDPDELAWSDTTNGDEDYFEQKSKEPKIEAQLSGEVKFQPPKPTDTVERIRLRTERQSLRRLPRTGAIVFTIRTYIFPIVDLAKEPGVPGRMASAIRSWPEDVQQYKGARLYKDIILPYLDEQLAGQIENGVVTDGDRKANYPY